MSRIVRRTAENLVFPVKKMTYKKVDPRESDRQE